MCYYVSWNMHREWSIFLGAGGVNIPHICICRKCLLGQMKILGIFQNMHDFGLFEYSYTAAIFCQTIIRIELVPFNIVVRNHLGLKRVCRYIRDHTFMTSIQKGGGGVLKFVTCLWILLLIW